MELRKGQWVKFDPPTEMKEAFMVGGKVVGIFHKLGESKIPSVIPVDVNGCNLPFVLKGKVSHRLAFKAEEITGIEPITTRTELPPGRSFHPDFVPG